MRSIPQLVPKTDRKLDVSSSLALVLVISRPLKGDDSPCTRGNTGGDNISIEMEWSLWFGPPDGLLGIFGGRMKEGKIRMTRLKSEEER